MRDLVAIAVVVVLMIFALSMATSLQWYRQGHARLRRRLRARGQSVVAEIPTADGLTFFSEDPTSFYWGEAEIPKEQIRAVRVLISGAPISVAVSSRFETTPAAASADPHDPPTGLERESLGRGSRPRRRAGARRVRGHPGAGPRRSWPGRSSRPFGPTWSRARRDRITTRARPRRAGDWRRAPARRAGPTAG